MSTGIITTELSRSSARLHLLHADPTRQAAVGHPGLRAPGTGWARGHAADVAYL